MTSWLRVVMAVGAVGVAACCGGKAATRPPDAAAAAEGREYRAGYASLVEDVKSGLSEGRCTVARTCGELQFVDCGQAADGPAYYVDSKSGAVLEVCGGGCFGMRETTCKACPPPEWTCSEQ